MIKYVKLAAPLWGGRNSATDVLFSLNPDFSVSFFLPRQGSCFDSRGREEPELMGVPRAGVCAEYICPHFPAGSLICQSRA